MVFIEGGQTLFIGTLIILVGLFVMQNQAKKGKTWNIRRIPGLDAIYEGIGRCVELGRPVHISAGIASGGPGDPDRTAAWPFISYVAKKCAEVNCRLIATVGRADALPILESVVKEAAIAAGNPEWYNPDDVRYLGENQYVYCAGVMGLLAREQCAMNLIFGMQRGGVILQIESGNLAGAFQIGGMARRSGELGFMALCDYSFLLEDMTAASAYISGDAEKISVIVVQDYVKFAIIAILILGTLLFTANINVISNILSM